MDDPENYEVVAVYGRVKFVIMVSNNVTMFITHLACSVNLHRCASVLFTDTCRWWWNAFTLVE